MIKPCWQTLELSGGEQEAQHTMMKLLNQLEHVDRATPFARRLDGKISEGIAHGTGLSGVSMSNHIKQQTVRDMFLIHNKRGL